MNLNLNLLPISFQKRLLVWARIRQWSVCLGIIMLLAACWMTIEYSRMTSERSRLSNLNAKAAPIRKVGQLNQVLLNQQQGLLKKEEAIFEIQNSNLHLQVLGMVSQSAKPLGSDIQIIKLSFGGAAKANCLK